MESRRHAAKVAPPPKKIASLADVDAKLSAILKEKVALQPLAGFTVIVEGQTDLKYLTRAIELVHAETGEDLLEVPAQLADRGDRILLCTPGTPGAPHRGGTPQMTRLARELQPYVFTLELLRGVLFVFDHDEAGREARQSISEYGFRPEQHSITLDPKEHPKACGNKVVVVEDLLCLGLQESFFDMGNAWCDVAYQAGQRVRFRWGHQSKGDLCSFACATGTLDDFEEIVRLARRLRRIFGFASGT